MAFTTKTAKIAGEKSRRGESKLTKTVRELISNEDAIKAISKLKKMALVDEDIKALELLLAYAFGKPKQQIDIEANGFPPIEIITGMIIK